MTRKKKKQQDKDLSIKTITAPPEGLTAIFEDGEGGYEEFPVILFAVFDTNGEGDVIGGLISAPDGLMMADHDDDFVGYRLEEQELGEFLEDHGRASGAHGEDDDEDEDEDDDESDG